MAGRVLFNGGARPDSARHPCELRSIHSHLVYFQFMQKEAMAYWVSERRGDVNGVYDAWQLRLIGTR